MSILSYKKSLIIFTLLALGITSLATARSFRVNQIPNGSVNSCSNCHVSAGGGGTRTAFGEHVLDSFLSGGNVVWGADLAAGDADGDGFSNGHELQDPFGLWSNGTANPGISGFVTNPGLVGSVPSGEAALFSIHATFSGMSPHSGNYFELKVIDSDNDELVYQETVSSIASADFEFVIMHKLQAGGNYNLDFWADLNSNGSYDAPPTDHAWRVPLSAVSNNVTSNFTHNTNFTDIGGTVAIDELAELPLSAQLLDNYPNPFNPTTRIRFELARQENISVDIFDVKGQLVSNLFSGVKSAGYHELSWDASNVSGEALPGGVYIYALRQAGTIQTGRMMLLK